MQQNARRQDLPPGIRFAPTPEELIVDYLNAWVSDPKHAVPDDPVTVCAADVYAEDPAALTARLRAAGHDDGNWYFLCVNRWKDGNVNCGRFNRTVGKGGEGGRWHGGAKRVAVGRHGYRLSFEHFDKDGDKTEWLMEEFGTALEAASSEQGVRVLCRVHRTPRADGEGGAAAARKGAGRTLPASKRRRGGKQACQEAAQPDQQQQGYLAAGGADLDAAWRQWQWQWQQQQAMTAQGAAPPADVGIAYDASTSGAVGVGTSYQWPQTTMMGEAAAASYQLPYTTSSSSAEGAMMATTYQQPQGMEQQGSGYQLYNGAHGGVHFQYEPEPLQVLHAEMEPQQSQMGYLDNGGVDMQGQAEPLETTAAADAELQQCSAQVGYDNGCVDVVEEQPAPLAMVAADVEQQQWADMGGGVTVKDEPETLETHTGEMEQQQWPEMGGVDVKDEPETFEMHTGDVEQQQWPEMGPVNGGRDVKDEPETLEMPPEGVDPQLLTENGHMPRRPGFMD
ncbi:hypothetical protein BS78_05G037900 [Paspalum vaginatum]|nr:hypothetical protein BS78_05G037900 [Paspalum vaginatum]